MHEYRIVILGYEGNEYHCLDCGRRIVLARRPYKKIVLDKGDDSVGHTVGDWIETSVEIEEVIEGPA